MASDPIHTRSSAVRWDDPLTILAFVLALWIPLLIALLQPAPDESAIEKRRLADFPEFTLEATRLAAWPAGVEAYYDDRMGLRTALIGARAWLWVQVLGLSPSDHLLVGRDGWLFNFPQRLRTHLHGESPLSTAESESWFRSFEERRLWLAERGIEYLVVFVPLKASVYPEQLPSWLRPLDNEPTERLARRLTEETSTRVVYLLDALKGAKALHKVYHRTDIHWNDSGAYVGYVEILQRLQELLPALRHDRPVEVRESASIVRGMGLAGMLGLSNSCPEAVVALEPVRPRAKMDSRTKAAMQARRAALERIVMQTGVRRRPKAIVFRDSFATALIPYLSHHFRRIVYEWNPDIDPVLVERESPDVVIHEIWSGRIYGQDWGPRPHPSWRHSAAPWMDRPHPPRE